MIGVKVEIPRFYSIIKVLRIPFQFPAMWMKRYKPAEQFVTRCYVYFDRNVKLHLRGFYSSHVVKNGTISRKGLWCTGGEKDSIALKLQRVNTLLRRVLSFLRHDVRFLVWKITVSLSTCSFIPSHSCQEKEIIPRRTYFTP